MLDWVKNIPLQIDKLQNGDISLRAIKDGTISNNSPHLKEGLTFGAVICDYSKTKKHFPRRVWNWLTRP